MSDEATPVPVPAPPNPNVPIPACVTKAWASVRLLDIVILGCLAYVMLGRVSLPVPDPAPVPPAPSAYITLPAVLNVPTGKMAPLHATTDNPDVQWAVVGKGGELAFSPKDSLDAYVTGPDKSTFTILAWTVFLDGPNKGKATPAARCVVVVGDVPPGPGPGPNPPVPPGPSPIPADGLHVLLVYDSDPAKYGAYTKTQISAIFGDKVTAYLDSHCKGNWRRFKDDEDAKNDDKIWQDAMKLPRQAMPWIIASDAKTGKYVTQAIPAAGFTDDDMVKLLQTVGGT